MSEIRTELDRIIAQVEEGHSKATAKGGTPQSSKTLENLLTAIDTIPEATEPKLQAKTATPATSAQTVKPDSGYDGLSQVTVNAMPTATQATPSISVSSAGLITASATQSAGYVAAGTKSATKQLTTQAAQTITPGTSNKTISSGRYLTGTQTIKGDANLVAGNIKQGVSIFGVAGSMTVGEDVTAETDTYTELLGDLEAAVDALPDAGSGGSGASVDTCSVRVYSNETNTELYSVSYTSFENGKVTTNIVNLNIGRTNYDFTFENVCCGTMFTWNGESRSGVAADVSGATEIVNLGYSDFVKYIITVAAGETATFRLYDDD